MLLGHAARYIGGYTIISPVATHVRAYVLVVVKGNIYTRKPCRGTTGKAQPEKLEWPWIKDNTSGLQLWMPNENLMSQFGNTFP